MSALRQILAASVAAATILLTGCLASAPVNSEGFPERPLRSGNGIVVSGTQIQAAGGALLDGLNGSVTSLRVERRASARCPLITLRGVRTLMRPSNPTVYVDGTQAVDTCILDQIRVNEVDHVEIYPGGLGGPKGYRSGPHGMILVFLTG